jgi:glycosyltransferase involved in cell wall biosynthesis
MNAPLPGPPLRIAVLGDFDGPHTRSWVRTFVQRGHEVHAISYYDGVGTALLAQSGGVVVHALQSSRDTNYSAEPAIHGGWTEEARISPLRRGLNAAYSTLPTSLQRYIQAWRYRRAGLQRLLDELRPDVFHAHYAVEHGFYGVVGYHPYVVSAWGSDLLVESYRGLNRRIARTALHAADLVTGNDASLVKRAIELGVPAERTAVVHLGIERLFLDAGEHSVNLRAIDTEPAQVISTRALEPLYNPMVLPAAHLRVRAEVSRPVRVAVAGDGSLRGALDDLARQGVLGGDLELLGHLNQAALAEQLARSQVYVSVPSSDSLALSNLEAMAAGSFPIVSDLPSVGGWIEDGVNGFLVPPRNPRSLSDAIIRALRDPELRRNAALHNRRLVEARGLREPNMLLMERHYYRLAGHPIEERGGI